MREIMPCLWFDTEGEEAANFYTSIFEDSRILGVYRYGDAGPREAGTVMTVVFEIKGQRYVALNGGPQFTFDEAISLQVHCDTQEEVDEYWERLTETDADTTERVTRAMLQMRKLDIATLEEAAAGTPA